jgi:hypothetical protein
MGGVGRSIRDMAFGAPLGASKSATNKLTGADKSFGGFNMESLDAASKKNALDLQAPDLTDAVIQSVKRAEALKLKTGRTRASTFVTENKKLGGGAY